jgi:hypothetical protein
MPLDAQVGAQGLGAPPFLSPDLWFTEGGRTGTGESPEDEAAQNPSPRLQLPCKQTGTTQETQVRPNPSLFQPSATA